MRRSNLTRGEVKARAAAAVDAILARNPDAWDCYMQNQRLQKRRAEVRRQIIAARERLAALQAEAETLGLEIGE